ncbi:MAG: stage II sporulation protein P [Oscillospiraceae bacterium]|nr:stage II sporulation protein P [Oscillospiraceae bacterium]
MKKTLVGTVLAGVILRLAVLAGAGDAMAAWVQELGVDERLVAAALKTELGTVPTELSDDETTIAAETEAPQDAAEFRLVPVTPQPSAEPVAAEEAEMETVSVTFDTSMQLNNRTSYTVDLEALADEGLSLRLEEGQPQILIIHTHSSEAYAQDSYALYEESDPYRTEDRTYSVIRVGDVLAEELEACGLTVLHDREIYDYPSYTGSYTRSGAAVENYLAEYLSLQIVIDLHRDAIGSGDVVYKTQATLDGKSSAQVMLLVGTGENGLSHPDWRENLKLALYLQSAAERAYPTLVRPIELVSERYNQHLSHGSLIMEVGSTGNTLQEALLAAELFGRTVGPELAALIE